LLVKSEDAATSKQNEKQKIEVVASPANDTHAGE